MPSGWRPKTLPTRRALLTPGPETCRVRADTDKMLASFRADAARDHDELRTDLRARAERAARQADADRDTGAPSDGNTPRRSRQVTQP